MSEIQQISGLVANAETKLSALAQDRPEVWAATLSNERIAATYARVVACSEYVSTQWLREPTLVQSLASQGRLLEVASEGWIESQLREHLRSGDEVEFMASLRAFRHRHSVRIAWRDIAAWADVEETLRDLSDLADACIRAAYEYAYALMTSRYGVPRGRGSGDAQPLMILAMG